MNVERNEDLSNTIDASKDSSTAKAAIEKTLEHLRTVHFATLATVFALLVAASLPPVGDLNRALTQLDEYSASTSMLERELDRLSSDEPVDVSKVFRAKYKIAEPQDYIFPLYLGVDRGDYSIHAQSSCTDTSSFFTEVKSDKSLSCIDHIIFAFVHADSLREMKESWNAVVEAKSCYVITKVLRNRITEDPRLNKRFILLNQQPKETAEFLAEVLHISPGAAVVRFDQVSAGINTGIGVSRVNVPVELRSVRCDVFLDAFNLSGLAVRGVEPLRKPFDDVFYDLAKFCSGLESLTRAEIRDYLRRLQSEKGNEVELYGVKVPQLTITLWGVLAVVTLQMYFLAHLIQSVRLASSESFAILFPWVPLYSGVLSRVITVGTVFLPCLTNVILVVKGSVSVHGPVKALCFFAAAMSFWLGAATIMRLRKLRIGVAENPDRG